MSGRFPQPNFTPDTRWPKLRQRLLRGIGDVQERREIHGNLNERKTHLRGARITSLQMTQAIVYFGRTDNTQTSQ